MTRTVSTCWVHLVSQSQKTREPWAQASNFSHRLWWKWNRSNLQSHILSPHQTRCLLIDRHPSTWGSKRNPSSLTVRMRLMTSWVGLTQWEHQVTVFCSLVTCSLSKRSWRSSTFKKFTSSVPHRLKLSARPSSEICQSLELIGKDHRTAAVHQMVPAICMAAVARYGDSQRVWVGAVTVCSMLWQAHHL